MYLLEENTGHRNASVRRLQTVVDGGWLGHPLSGNGISIRRKVWNCKTPVTIVTMRVWGTQIV